MKIAIVGAGAIGSYYGARLAVAGHDVRFLARSDYAIVKAQGLTIESLHGDIRLPEVSVYEDSREIGEVDLVIVSWKTTSNHDAREVLSPLMSENTKIITLQNGLGNVEVYSELFGEERVLAGLCFICCNKISPGYVRHSASGLVRMAWADRQVDTYLEALVRNFQQAEIPCEAMDNLEKALWMKLIWNYPFNGLSITEGGVDTEVILKDRGLEPLVRKIMAEVVMTSEVLGHPIPASIIDDQINLTKKMGGYKPSSMIDFVSGSQVELDSIWGKPVAVAEKLGLEVPEMKKLLERIQEALKNR